MSHVGIGAGRDAAIHFRAMRVQDLDDVLRNETRAYAFPWTRGMFADCLIDAQFDARLVVFGDEIVGHGVLSSGADEAHVLNVCIARRWQGRGWGRTTMLHLLERARTIHDARIVFLEVRPSNGIALSLYDSLGFREVGRRPNYYPAAIGHEDACVMALEFDRLGGGAA
ncbi:MAG: ribosomal protein S18-alanine N-acetyltransferase [Pseudomonadales bacterium]